MDNPILTANTAGAAAAKITIGTDQPTGFRVLMNNPAFSANFADAFSHSILLS